MPVNWEEPLRYPSTLFIIIHHLDYPSIGLLFTWDFVPKLDSVQHSSGDAKPKQIDTTTTPKEPLPLLGITDFTNSTVNGMVTNTGQTGTDPTFLRHFVLFLISKRVSSLITERINAARRSTGNREISETRKEIPVTEQLIF